VRDESAGDDLEEQGGGEQEESRRAVLQTPFHHQVDQRQGEGDEAGLLLRALTAAFEQASAAGWSSLAFPAVSSGIFAVPVGVCAHAYVRAARDWLARSPRPALRTLRLCLRDQPLIDAVLAELRRA